MTSRQGVVLRLADYRPVLLSAFMYATSVVAVRVAFEDGANTATVVTLRCLWAAIAISLFIQVNERVSQAGASRRGTTARER